MDKEVVAGVNSIWATSFEAQERRVAVLEQAIVAVVAGTLDEAAREAAAHAAHKLAGSLGTFGLEEGSRLAAEIEQAWAASASAAQDVSALAKSVASLRGVLAAHRPPQTDQQAEEPVQVADALDVLLVDDDEVFARYVVDALQRRYRVSWVSTGESALAAIARGAKGSYPKVVLLDIEMPGMKGLKVLEQLAKLGIKGQCAIVMLTRRTIAEDVVRARQLGARDFLAKPISVSVLTERVGRALESVR